MLGKEQKTRLIARVRVKNDNNERATDGAGRKRDAKGTGRLQMHSALTALPPPGCLRVLSKAVLTKRANEGVRVSVGRQTKTTAPVGVEQERGCQGVDCLQK